MKIKVIAPTRISLAGGGSDISPYCDEYGGAAVNMAINVRQELTLYTGEDIHEHLYHTVPYGADASFAYKILDEYGINGMHHSSLSADFDGVVGAGLGSSASFAVALTAACQKNINFSTEKDFLAQRAWEIETRIIKNFSGKQDHYAAAYGGFNFMIFSNDVEVFPFTKSNAERLHPSMVLVYAGGTRSSSKIQRNFKKPTKKQIFALNKSKMLAYEIAKYIKRDNVEMIGKVLDEVWHWKKEANKDVTNKEIESLYEFGKAWGAYGGKLLGAGQAGYMLFIVPPTKRQAFIKNMVKLKKEVVDFSPCFNGVEVKVL